MVRLSDKTPCDPLEKNVENDSESFTSLHAPSIGILTTSLFKHNYDDSNSCPELLDMKSLQQILQDLGERPIHGFHVER